MDCLLCRYFRPSESEIEIISERKKRIKNNKNEANYNIYSTNNNITNTDDEIKTSKNHIINQSYEKQINDLNIKNSQKQQRHSFCCRTRWQTSCKRHLLLQSR